MVNLSKFQFSSWKLILTGAHVTRMISENHERHAENIKVQRDSILRGGAGAALGRVAREVPPGDDGNPTVVQRSGAGTF